MMSDGPFTRYGETYGKVSLLRFLLGFAILAVVLFGMIGLAFYLVFTDHVWWCLITMAGMYFMSGFMPPLLADLVLIGAKNEQSS